MSDSLKHECGIALIRLKKPLEFFKEKYGTSLYPLNKLYLLMEKQHNRGQDGAGVAVLKQTVEPGHPYIFRHRSHESNPLPIIFDEIFKEIRNSGFIDPQTSTENPTIEYKYVPYLGDVYLGHLRYGTYGTKGIHSCHPFIRQSNWKTKNLILAGNFNMTNNDELFQKLISIGQHPRNTTDTVTVLERLGHSLDEEVEKLYTQLREKGLNQEHINEEIFNKLELEEILKSAVPEFDGGYAIAGILGDGDSFVIRDPNGIRPAHWFENDELVVVTSERPPIKTAFDVDYKNIKEVEPGTALIISKTGETRTIRLLPERKRTSCSFERIYFSRGTDTDIYQERKMLGKLLLPQILKSIEGDIEKTVFSYIPNTAEVAFFGLMSSVHDYLNDFKKDKILQGSLDPQQLTQLLSIRPRAEKIAVKDAKLRTFITSDEQRSDLVSHVYDTTYGVIKSHEDNLVIIDDSIVRGTTLKNSILRILDRLKPKKIIVVSSAPQIRYPDCYGIDMSKLNDFIAFRAAIALLKDNHQEALMEEVYIKCKKALESKSDINHVREIYDQFTDEQISVKIAQMLKSDLIKAEVDVIYQTIENLHLACPEHSGDWYFTGNYPTQGGNRVANQSFINYYEGNNKRAY